MTYEHKDTPDTDRWERMRMIHGDDIQPKALTITLPESVIRLEETVEAAAKVEWEHAAEHRWENLPERIREHLRAAMRAALAAALAVNPPQIVRADRGLHWLRGEVKRLEAENEQLRAVAEAAQALLAARKAGFVRVDAQAEALRAALSKYRRSDHNDHLANDKEDT